jgi:hypothetical protein
MAFSVTITGPGRIKQPYPELFRNQLKACALRMGLELKRRMVKRSLRLADSGTMADSWAVNPANPVVKGNVVTITVVATGPGGITALVWEKGTRASRHPFPPTRQGSPLRRWVRRRLGIQDDKEAGRVAFAIARSIKQRGLPNPANSARRRVGVFSRTLKRSIPAMNRIAQSCQAKIAVDFTRNR